MSEDSTRSTIGPITRTNRDVTVTKRVHPVGTELVAVECRVESNRSDAVHVKLSDRLPRGISHGRIESSDVGDAIDWQVTDRDVVGITTLEPGDERLLSYGIDLGDGTDATDLTEAPRLEVAPSKEASTDSDSDSGSGSDSDVDSDPDSGSASSSGSAPESVPASDTTPSTEDSSLPPQVEDEMDELTEMVETAREEMAETAQNDQREATDEASSGGTSTSESDADASAGAPTEMDPESQFEFGSETSTETDEDSLDALTTRLEDASEEELAAVRSALGVTSAESPDTGAQPPRDDLAELLAYRESLEEAYRRELARDWNGEAVRAEYEALQKRIDETETEADLEAMLRHLSRLEHELAHVETQLQELRGLQEATATVFDRLRDSRSSGESGPSDEE